MNKQATGLSAPQLTSARDTAWNGHSWRTDGPIVAKVFPQFATKPKSVD
jgi:hypothetical protein